MQHVVKRNGEIVDFDIKKIQNAIRKASLATGEFDLKTAEKLAFCVMDILFKKDNKNSFSVEEIQDVVEDVLMSSEYKKTAKSYILYRQQHSKIREFVENANVDMVDDYIQKIDWKVRENSNMTYSVQGLNNYISSNITKNYWLNKIYSTEVKTAHENGDIHIHDLNIIAPYCVGWDLADFLTQGFGGVVGKVHSKPAKHFRSALMQIANFLYTMQGEAAGAQAFSNFDTLLAPFIRFDKLNYSEVKQAMQEFVFNLNVPTRVGFQTPFTNLTMDLKPPSYLKNQYVICQGAICAEKYGDFQDEMNMLNKAFFEVMLQGDAIHQVFTFPIPTYNITKDFDFEDKNLDGLFLMSAKYGIPYFSNFVNSNMNPSDARSMCCRLRIDNRKLLYRGGGLFGSNPLTGSIGVVTINMPKIGFFAKDEKEYFEILKSKMDIAKRSLEEKRKVIEKLTDFNLYPYTKYYLRNIKERFGEYWKNHFSTIGLLGMNESMLNFLNKGIETKEGREFSLKVLDFMREVITEYQIETNNNYNLEATPAEGASYRLAKLDKEKYEEIIVANEEDYRKNNARPFYTNSSQLPVNFSDDIFEVLDNQDEFQTKYTGGTVLHIYAGEKISDIEVIKNLVKKVCNNYKLPYFTFTPTFSICKNHGYLEGEHFVCNKCNEKCEVFSRIVGYIRPLNQWNEGKIAEYNLRKTFKVEKIQK